MTIVSPKGHTPGCFCDWCMAVKRSNRPSFPSAYSPPPPRLKFKVPLRPDVKRAEARIRQQVAERAGQPELEIESRERHPSTVSIEQAAEIIDINQANCRFCSEGNGPLCRDCRDTLTELRDWLHESKSP